jgi:hypothetical protein
MISGLVGITSFSLYNFILLIAGFVILVLGLTFLMDALADMKTKQTVMASLDTLLGVGLNIIGLAVMFYIWVLL